MLGILHQGVVLKPKFGCLIFIYSQVSVGDQPSFSSCQRTARCTSIFDTFLFSSSPPGGKGHSLAKIWNAFGLISLISWSFTLPLWQMKAIHPQKGTTQLLVAPFSRPQWGRCVCTSHFVRHTIQENTQAQSSSQRDDLEDTTLPCQMTNKIPEDDSRAFGGFEFWRFVLVWGFF